MKLPEFTPKYSRLVLMGMGITLLLIILLVLWQWPSIHQLYFDAGTGNMGLMINAGIIGLFFSGLSTLVRALLRYNKEEKALANFLRNVRQRSNPLINVPETSLIISRWNALEGLQEQSASIDPAPLASIMLAKEYARLSNARFIQNTLILAGVFGTIISLSIALLGASELMHADGATQGIDKVIFGMSTALSTTVTAIVCYFVLGFFHTKTLDAQSQVILMVETISTQILVPQFQSNAHKINEKLDQLVTALGKAAESLASVNTEDHRLETLLEKNHRESTGNMAELLRYLENLQSILKNGFRLGQ